MLARLQLPSTLIIGGGARLELAAQVARLGASRVLLVTDPGIARLGHVDECRRRLEEAGIAVEVFDGVAPDPTVSSVLAGLERLRAARAEAVVALGGGSPIDAAKAIAMLAANPLPLSQYQGYHHVGRGGLPLVAVPTTAGTGSEATQVTVITDEARSVKMMILDAHLTPRVALVDYELSLSMPPALTAAVGIDTLTHGIEAYISRRAHATTDPLALSCVALVGEHLLAAYARGDDHQARAGMMLAACHGGLAFSNASLALVHGMSRPLGAVYHLAHGLSNAVLLATVTEFSLPAARARYATLARTLAWARPEQSEPAAAAALVDGLRLLTAELSVPRLGQVLGVTLKQFEGMLGKLADDALASGSPQNNPRVPSRDEIVELYRQAW